jgi:hypothetical protein
MNGGATPLLSHTSSWLGAYLIKHRATLPSPLSSNFNEVYLLCHQVEVIPRTTCWPGRSLLIMALSFPEKQSWVSALEAVVQGYNNNRMEGDNGQPVRYQGNTVIRLDEAEMLDLNCCLQLSPEVQFSL